MAYEHSEGSDSAGLQRLTTRSENPLRRKRFGSWVQQNLRPAVDSLVELLVTLGGVVEVELVRDDQSGIELSNRPGGLTQSRQNLRS
ncbi:MAG: hypothetical protein QOD39_507 [Mycobacterium sp.]|nr:hypothetical protein [Mycobacterium sp.]